MRINSFGDIKFENFYSQSGNTPKWFVVLINVLFISLKIGALYGIAKLGSIEAALIIYILYVGILGGIDDYNTNRDMNMLVWNNEQLSERIATLEHVTKRD